MSADPATKDLSKSAYDHLWMHFTRMSSYENNPVPTIVSGEGTYIYDSNGRRYLDGLAGLFVVQVGHGRAELAEVARKQAEKLAFFPIWSYAHPNAIELAERLANYAPGDLNKVFFTTGGGEAVETAWKLAKQYFKLTGEHTKYKVISRAVAYHGTPQGALSITGLPALKAPFEPLVPGAHKVVNTNIYRAPIYGDNPEAYGRWCADQIEQDYLSSRGFGSVEQVTERLAENGEHGLGYAIHYFPEAAYDLSGVELFERDVIGALA